MGDDDGRMVDGRMKNCQDSTKNSKREKMDTTLEETNGVKWLMFKNLSGMPLQMPHRQSGYRVVPSNGLGLESVKSEHRITTSTSLRRFSLGSRFFCFWNGPPEVPRGWKPDAPPIAEAHGAR